MHLSEILSIDKEKLGEACGIFAGAGGLYYGGKKCVLEIRVGRGEREYLEKIVKPLFESTFPLEFKRVKRFYQDGYVLGIRCCGRRAERIFHTLLEFPIGRKSGNLHVPKIIRNNMDYWKAYIRGFFDTRGTVYSRVTRKKYKSMVLEMRSPSLIHLIEIREMVNDLGFKFWLEKGNYKIRMAGKRNVERFFKDINPHNNAKWEKYRKFVLRWPRG